MDLAFAITAVLSPEPLVRTESCLSGLLTSGCRLMELGVLTKLPFRCQNCQNSPFPLETRGSLGDM